jgi:hypothetical protein
MYLKNSYEWSTIFKFKSDKMIEPGISLSTERYSEKVFSIKRFKFFGQIEDPLIIL